jgi:hypothetical protein
LRLVAHVDVRASIFSIAVRAGTTSGDMGHSRRYSWRDSAVIYLARLSSLAAACSRAWTSGLSTVRLRDAAFAQSSELTPIEITRSA